MDKIGPMVEINRIRELAGADLVDPDDVTALARGQHRGNEIAGELLARNDHCCSTRIAKDMGVIAGGIGGVGSGTADAKPAAMMARSAISHSGRFADQRDLIAWTKPDANERSGERGNLTCSLGPADGSPLTIALDP